MELIDDLIDGKKTGQIGLRLPDDMDRAFRMVAEEAGVTPQALMRVLIAQHLKVQRDKYHALRSIFGDGGAISKDIKASKGTEE
jgi:hypothetical protein